MSQWKETICAERVSVAEVIRRATETRVDGYGGKPEFVHAEFHDALMTVAGRGGAVNGRALGRWLQARADRIVDGARIVRGELRSGVATWSIGEA